MDWINTNDFDSEWSGDPACQDYHYLADVDFFKGADAAWSHHHLIVSNGRQWRVYVYIGKCDVGGKGGATSGASCCAFCSQAADCHAFTYLQGMCFLKSCEIHDDKFTGLHQVGMPGAVTGWKIK